MKADNRINTTVVTISDTIIVICGADVIDINEPFTVFRFLCKPSQNCGSFLALSSLEYRTIHSQQNPFPASSIKN